jgi:hypothetical protein
VKSAILELLNRLLPFLDVDQDQRACLRLPFTGPVHVYPVDQNQKIGEPIQGEVRNLSMSGAGLELSQRPPPSQVYLHFPEIPALSSHALRARVVHVGVRDTAKFEIGVSFLPCPATEPPATGGPPNGTRTVRS